MQWHDKQSEDDFWNRMNFYLRMDEDDRLGMETGMMGRADDESWYMREDENNEKKERGFGGEEEKEGQKGSKAKRRGGA